METGEKGRENLGFIVGVDVGEKKLNGGGGED